MDAVDVALVDFDRAIPDTLATLHSAWDPALRRRLLRVAAGHALPASEFADLDAQTGLFFATKINELLQANATRPDQVAAIGCHGQTVAHAPLATPATTLQLGDANLIAEWTGITTINDFRRRDLAVGGQGAPLAPAFHAALMRSDQEARVVLNLGGIANVTILPADAAVEVIGFDTGPANCLMDGWIRRHLDKPFDRGGRWAASAEAHPGLLDALLNDPFFELGPPKSTGTQYFSDSWLESTLNRFNGVTAQQVQASLLALTSRSVTDAIRRRAPATQRILVCGGGAHNHALLEQLRCELQIPIESTASVGFDPDWVEAIAFAWLARRTLTGEAGNLPSVTGARAARILGAIHPA